MAIKHSEEYRDADLARALAEKIRRTRRRSIRLMEVCGTHTVSIFRSGIRSVLPPTVSLLSGPGCPVCVTPAMRSVAIDIPGAAKAQIGRLTYVESDHIPIFGVPKLFMSVVRSADMNKTPDIRTRTIVPEWACRIGVTYVKPILREKDVVNLLAAAGIMRGVGDWRPEKGSGNYGQFKLVEPTDKDWLRITKTGGRAVQDEALRHPEMFDAETARMYSWFTMEAAARGFAAAVA